METLHDDVLRAIAPDDLPSFRASRTDFAPSLGVDAFTAAQLSVLRRLYDGLEALRRRTSVSDAPDAVSPTDVATSDDALLRAAADARLLRAEAVTPLVARALHDVRGGALAALTLALTHARASSDFCDEAARARRSIHFLARDQLKIMRSAIAGLDQVAEAHDRELRPHALADVTAGLRDLRLPVRGVPAPLALHLGYEGVIAGSCMEAAALRRVLYNLVNNAASHASAAPVHVSALAVPRRTPHSVRIVVENEIDLAEETALAAALRAPADDALAPLWDRYTTTGSGLGLSIVLHTVADAHGLERIADAVHLGYAGATIVPGPRFVSWFHWPLPV